MLFSREMVFSRERETDIIDTQSCRSTSMISKKSNYVIHQMYIEWIQNLFCNNNQNSTKYPQNTHSKPYSISPLKNIVLLLIQYTVRLTNCSNNTNFSPFLQIQSELKVFWQYLTISSLFDCEFRYLIT